MTKLILGKVEMALKGRLASIKARDLVRRKGPLDGMRLPGKLADCSSKNPKDCEIFIVEGDSAGGSAKEGRDRNTQAILPLRGKVINVEKAPLHKMLENNEIQALITAIGIGISTGDSSEDEEEELVKSEPEQAVETNGKRKKNQKEDDKNLEINLDNLRYDKIIILTDADVDGEHIKTLLLTFFFRFMRELIKLGHVYVAVPPIYKFSYKKHEEYYYEETALTKDIGEFCKKFNIPDPKSVSIQRYKGLGEMNPDQLAETTMDPNSRRLIRVNFEDFISSDIMFSKLMGTDVAPRKEYIMEHYNEVMNIDI
jgi:DNA gyrase subunit B